MGETMDYSKKNKIDIFLIFVFLVVFPFGQLLRKTININGFQLAFNSSDIVVGIIFLYSLYKQFNFFAKVKIFRGFIYAALFSLVISIFLFNYKLVFLGALYFIRVLLYINFFAFCKNVLNKRKGLILNSLIAVTTFSAIFGWIQYLLWPDLRPLYSLGWDDHYYRLVGAFLDPGFTGIILVLGLVSVIYKYFFKRDNRLLLLVAFFIISIAFTYSRASYLALSAALVYIAISTKKFWKIVVVGIFSLSIVYFLPNPGGQGVNLARQYSIIARLENYTQTVNIFEKSPLFGVGFNNICLAKQKYIESFKWDSHSCSGSDSSILLILATTGIVGFIIFTDCLVKLFSLMGKGYYKNIFIASSIALFFHSLFHNSLFYSWVMGYFAMLLSIQKFKE